MKYVFSILLLLFSLIVFGQMKNDIIQERIEFIAQELEVEDISLEEFFDILNNYYDNKINLNEARKEDLQSLLMINDFQIESLLKWREEKGLLQSIYELQNIPYWDLQTIDNIFPFVRVSEIEKKEKKNFAKYVTEGNFEGYFRYIRNIEDKAGYADVDDEVKENSNKYYWGDPSRIYSRLRYTHKNDLSLGVTMNKSPGEQIFGKTQPYGFDFYSAHAYYDNGKKIFRKAVIGDFHMQIGQGLAFWTGYSFGKTADAGSARKNARGLRPYTSTDEARFMRGAGVEIGISDFSLTTFVSYKGLDGTVEFSDTLEDEEARLASSINMSGYHRTTSELNRKNSINEFIYGANLKYETRNLQIGVSAIQQTYDLHIEREESLVNKYQFKGKELLNLSADYSYIIRNVSLYGEVAQSMDTKSVAILQGLSLALGRRATLTALYRNYPKDYHSFYGRGFGDGSNTINESGIYIGSRIRLSKSWTFNTYIDFFKSPWLKFRVDSPSDGHEVLAQLKYRPSPRFEAQIRFREKDKMQNESGSNENMRIVERYKQRKYQLSLSTELGNGWTWKSRFDYVTDNRPSKGLQSGYALSQDILYRNKNFPVQVYLRYSIFNTDSYDTRLYVYEYNMQNVFSIPTYYNSGSRAYAMLRYTFLNGKMDIWVRYGIFIYHQMDRISSGSEEIQGNIKSEFGAQLRVKL
ncbi:MAG: helix-hairpin-helix domain-containing protein [Brumimicrobium sp.]